jgi:hypothetical protein
MMLYMAGETTPELEHLRAAAVLWQPNVSRKYSAIRTAARCKGNHAL